MNHLRVPAMAEFNDGTTAAYEQHVLVHDLETDIAIGGLTRRLEELHVENEELTSALALSEKRADDITSAFYEVSREATQLRVDNAQHKELIGRLTAKGEKDPKTQLLNSEAFKEKVLKDIRYKRRMSSPESANYLIFADLDDFKSWNDYFTDTINDFETLIPAARVLGHTIRSGEGYVCRWGGEEFAIFLRNVTHAEVLAFAGRLREGINRIPTTGTPPNIDRLGISIGFTEIDGNNDYDAALDRADAAVKHIKRNIPGKNNIVDHADIAHTSRSFVQPTLFDLPLAVEQR